MNNFGKFKYEIILLVLFLAFWAILPLSSSDPTLNLIYKLLLIADFAAFFSTLLRLWREKWSRRVANITRKAFVKVAKFFIRVAETLNLRSKSKNFLSGETKVVFNIEKNERGKKSASKSKKWKHLEDGRAKLRYLYRYTVNEQIKHGERIYASNTPSELLQKQDNSEADRAVFDLYVNYRYDERSSPSEKEISELKEKHFDNVK